MKKKKRKSEKNITVVNGASVDGDNGIRDRVITCRERRLRTRPPSRIESALSILSLQA